jgi:PleD family two-component response regulator
VINRTPENPETASPPPMTVLLVDDQRFIGLVLARLLAPAPEITLHQCTEAAEAIAQARDLRPDVILQDLVMDIDGLTVVAEFRGNAGTATTPIVVLSGNDDAATRASATAAGANDFLVKFPSSDDLIACLRRHAVNGRSSAAAVSTQYVEQMQ